MIHFRQSNKYTKMSSMNQGFDFFGSWTLKGIGISLSKTLGIQKYGHANLRTWKMICFRRTGCRLFVGGFVGCPNCLRHACDDYHVAVACSFADAPKNAWFHLLHAQLSFTLGPTLVLCNVFVQKIEPMNCSIFCSNFLKGLDSDEPRSFNKSSPQHLVFVHREILSKRPPLTIDRPPVAAGDRGRQWEIPQDDSYWHHVIICQLFHYDHCIIIARSCHFFRASLEMPQRSLLAKLPIFARANSPPNN